MRRRTIVIIVAAIVLLVTAIYALWPNHAAETQSIESITAPQDCPRTAVTIVENGGFAMAGGASDGVKYDVSIARNQNSTVTVFFMFDKPGQPFGWWVKGTGIRQWRYNGPTASASSVTLSSTGIFTVYLLWDDPTKCTPIVNALLADFNVQDLQAQGQWPKN